MCLPPRRLSAERLEVRPPAQQVAAGARCTAGSVAGLAGLFLGPRVFAHDLLKGIFTQARLAGGIVQRQLASLKAPANILQPVEARFSHLPSA